MPISPPLPGSSTKEFRYAVTLTAKDCAASVSDDDDNDDEGER